LAPERNVVALITAAGLIMLSASVYEGLKHAPPGLGGAILAQYGAAALVALVSVRTKPGYSASFQLLRVYSGSPPRPLGVKTWVCWQAAKVMTLSWALSDLPIYPLAVRAASGDVHSVVLLVGCLLGPTVSIRVAMKVASASLSAFLDATEYRSDGKMLASAMTSHGLRLASYLLLYTAFAVSTFPTVSVPLLPAVVGMGVLGLDLNRASKLPWSDPDQFASYAARRVKVWGLAAIVTAAALVPLSVVFPPSEVSSALWSLASGEKVVHHPPDVHPATLLGDPAIRRLASLHGCTTQVMFVLEKGRLYLALPTVDGRHTVLFDPMTGKTAGRGPAPPPEPYRKLITYVFPFCEEGIPVYVPKIGWTVSLWLRADEWIPLAGFDLLEPYAVVRISGVPSKVKAGPGFPSAKFATWFPVIVNGKGTWMAVDRGVFRLPGELIPVGLGVTLDIRLLGPKFPEIVHGVVYALEPVYTEEGTVKGVKRYVLGTVGW